ncbi:M24 family metallopeptidase [Pseudotabrizicola formosa]|uniref:M24 family metallopeptidase n=1 Tax=Pseudotabrizicola formosa TaxID=2030009 RepID=UPI00225E2980|nr:Xaa-Pro peptidase family protein [Pseudotabrizicola formosa]
MTQTHTRLAALRAIMQQTGTTLTALAPGAHMHWVLGYHPHPDERSTYLLVGPESAAMVVPSVNAQDIGSRVDVPMHVWTDEDGPSAALGSALVAVVPAGAVRVSLDETMRADAALLLLDQLPAAERSFATETVGALRMRKDDAEFSALKAAALVADHAMRAGFAALRPGQTERQVADAIRAGFAQKNTPSAFCLVASGPNGAYPHHSTGERVLQTGDAVVIDIGGTTGGFPSDMTRMAIVGHAPEGYDAVHAVVERAVQAAMAAARPGVAAQAVDKAARDVITQAGYGEYFVHRTGHGLGLEVHEPPYLTATSETVLQEGMVFSIEPGIYIPGRFGIRLEEIVILRKDGPEILSSLPRTAFVAA